MNKCLIWKEEKLKACIEEADQGYSKCVQEADQGYSECVQEADQGYSKCTQEADQGYSNCSQATNNRYSKCSSWGPFSGLCLAFAWFDNWICNAYTWVSNVVCVVWTWVKKMVCVAWTWVRNVVCVAWTWVKKMVCVLWVYTRTAVCLFWINIQKLWDFIIDVFKHWWWTLIYWKSGIKCYVSPNPIEKDGWKLVFNDEFDGGALDTTNSWQTRANWMVRPTLSPTPWGVYPFYDSTNPLQYFDDSCLSLNNSILTISSEYAPKSFAYTDPISLQNSNWNIDYKSGWIETKQFYHYGFFEVRCKIPDASGSWPAFWFMGHPWPPEIDVFEFWTSDSIKSIQKTNIHWGPSKEKKEMKSKGHRVCDAGKDFNIYGFEWREGYMKWYFNNVLIRTESLHMNEFVYPMKLIIGSGMEDYFANPSVINGLPHKFEIDYVRIYN